MLKDEATQHNSPQTVIFEEKSAALGGMHVHVHVRVFPADES